MPGPPVRLHPEPDDPTAKAYFPINLPRKHSNHTSLPPPALRIHNLKPALLRNLPHHIPRIKKTPPPLPPADMHHAPAPRRRERVHNVRGRRVGRQRDGEAAAVRVGVLRRVVADLDRGERRGAFAGGVSLCCREERERGAYGGQHLQGEPARRHRDRGRVRVRLMYSSSSTER